MDCQENNRKNILTSTFKSGNSQLMNWTETPKTRLKRVFAWVPQVVHARAKASAAMHGQDFQEWIAEALAEKLVREDRAKAGAR
jgi:hypothetical protein